MALKSAWTTAPLGRMAPIEQAKLWAIRAVLVDQGEAADQYQRMSRLVVKVGGGHPDRHVVKKFFARVDKDPLGWYPGKAAVGVGRPVELTGAAAKKICNSMMAATRRKLEPSYDLACALCPSAVKSPRRLSPRRFW